MPNINLLSGKVKLLKSDEHTLQQSMTLVDVLTEHAEHLFGEDEQLEKDLVDVADPLARIALKVKSKTSPPKKAKESESKESEGAARQTAPA